ncbi:hypothetical protein M0R45_007834 [Rubus argutus]|uniref:Uncharacterized protein n=1 Tax=Rubus argutus TaxID=59490 RepID=A0AAW1XYZ2_RUBAR
MYLILPLLQPKRQRVKESSSSSRIIHPKRNVDMTSHTSYLGALQDYIENWSLTHLASDNNGYNEDLVRKFCNGFPQEESLDCREVTVKVSGKRGLARKYFVIS